MTTLGPLLRLIGLRRLRERPAASLRAGAAVMVGVGAILASRLVTIAITRGVADGLEAFSGRTALRLDGGAAGLPESLLDSVRGVEGVEAAVPLLESPAHLEDDGGETLTVVGVDLEEERRVRHYAATAEGEEPIDDPLVFLSQPDSIILTRAWAARQGLHRGDRFTLQTPAGRRSLVVRGLLEPEGPARAFAGALALMDYQAAQVAFAKPGRVDEIDVVAASGADVGRLADALRAVAGTGVRVDSPSAFGTETALAARSVTALFWLLSVLIVIVAMFLLHNAVTMNVARRGEEIALMRALGVRRRDAVWTILLEAAVLGIAGAFAGVPFGLLLARLMLGPTTSSVTAALVAPVAAAELGSIGVGHVAGAAILGLAISMLAAWLPARQAARFAPAVAARRGAVIALREARAPSPWFGVTCLATGIAATGVAFASGSTAIGPVADAAFVVAFALFATPVVRRIVPALEWLLRPVGALGRIAALNVAATPQRSANTVTPLMVAVALVVVVATVQRSFRVTFDEWFAGFDDRTLHVASVSQDPSRAVLLPDAVAEAIAAVPGVAKVHRFRFMHATYGGRRIGVEYTDYDADDPTRGSIRFRSGDPARAFARLAAGEAVVVSDNFAMHFGLGPGDAVQLPTPAGVRTLAIAATAVNYHADQGTIVMSRDLFVTLFGDERVQFILVTAAPDAGIERVRAAIAARHGREHALVIFTLGDLRRDITARIDQAFLPGSGLLLLAVMVGSLGVANALAVAVEERRREVGTLRALGARRREISVLVVTQAMALGLLGVVLGLALGALLSYLWVVLHVRHVLGWIIGYHFAPRGAVVGVLAALLATPLAAWWPARHAARLHPVDTLASE